MDKKYRAGILLSSMLAMTGKTMDDIIPEAGASVSVAPDGGGATTVCETCGKAYDAALTECPWCEASLELQDGINGWERTE